MSAIACPMLGSRMSPRGRWSGLQCDPHVVALVEEVGADDVERVAERSIRRADVLAAAVLRAPRPPHITNVFAPSEAARSKLPSTLASA